MQNTLREMLEELRFGELSWGSSAPNDNLRMLTFHDEVPVKEIEKFIRAAASICSVKAKQEAIQTASFYVWHDEMAGQLRFSVAGSAVDSLPFAGEIEVTEDLLPILEAARQNPGVIRWEELSAAQNSDGKQGEAAVPFVLKVWAHPL